MKRLHRLLAVLVFALPAVPASAGWDKSPGGGALDQALDQNDPHVRYPADRAYPFGTVQVKNGRKIPYVERCYWTAERGFLGLPRNLKLTCYRYTPENTGLKGR